MCTSLRNALDHLPRKANDDCLQELRWFYDRRDVAEAQKDLTAWLARWQKTYPKHFDWAEETASMTQESCAPAVRRPCWDVRCGRPPPWGPSCVPFAGDMPCSTTW